MLEKTLELEDWPDAKVTIRMYTMMDVTDIQRSMTRVPNALPFTGDDLKKFFKKALVHYENVPLMGNRKFTGDIEAKELDYITPLFAFDVIMGALAYSRMDEEETKNS